jgi:hypothetical protein
MSGVSLGFQMEPLSVPLANILPSRKIPSGLELSRKFKQIKSSIEAVGLIEPLSVTPAIKATGQHMLLDGHIRLIALRDLGQAEAPCLVAKDDEAYTYNNRINRLSTIQEHFMLRRAIKRGVSPDRLAKALSVDVSTVIKKMGLLDGICPEAAELLKDHTFSAELSRVLRKMRPTRQVECVERNRLRCRSTAPCLPVCQSPVESHESLGSRRHRHLAMRPAIESRPFHLGQCRFRPPGLTDFAATR